MTTYYRPDVYVEEIKRLDSPVVAAATGFGGLLGVTQKGPVGSVVRTRNFAQWQKIFGDRETRSDTAYEAELFFAEGGVELITGRILHFSDVDDPSTYTGGVATKTVLSVGTDPTAAEKTGAIETYNLEPGQTVLCQVDNDVGGVETATFDAVAATVTGVGLSITDINGETVILEMNNDGNTQTVTFTATHLGDPDGAIAEMNAQLNGCSVDNNGGQVRITSDLRGTNSEIDITGGTALIELGLSVGVTTETTSDVANIDEVTATEVKTIFENDFTGGSGVTVTVNANGSFTIKSNTTGATSELDFTGGTALATLGLSVETINGTDAGTTYDTLKFESGYMSDVSPGEKGNDLAFIITHSYLHPSQGAGNDLAADITASDTSLQVTTLSGLNQYSVIKVTDGVNIEYKEVTGVRTVVSGGTVSFHVDISGTFTNGYVVANTTVESVEFDLEIFDNNVLVETWTYLSMLDTADNYVETILNDENIGSQYFVATDLDAASGIGRDLPAENTTAVSLAGGSDETTGLVDADWIGSVTGKTGLYLLDDVNEFMPFAFVGNNNVAPVHAALNYAESRLWFEFIGYVTIGSTAAQAVSYRENTLGANSSYGDLYAGGVKVFDSEGNGTSPRRLLNGVGAFMGIRARVDALPSPNGGPWQTPAGEGDYGRIKSALDVATIYNDTDAADLNKAHINAIRKFGTTSPVLVFGGRTLDATTAQRFRYINVRRFFQFAEKSIADSTRWGILRNNDFILWGKLKDAVDTWLSGLMEDRAFPTADKNLAFFIKMGFDDGTMDQTDVDNGRVIGEIGLAPQKPGEFIIWRFTQFEAGTSIEEL
jgi:phage tail sheath protein FI